MNYRPPSKASQELYWQWVDYSFAAIKARRPYVPFAQYKEGLR